MARRSRNPRWLEAARAVSTTARSLHSRGDYLSRALARAGVLPPAELAAALRAGRVRVDGAVVRSGFTPVRRDSCVRLDGHVVALDASTLVLVLHKSAGLVVAGTDPYGGGTVFEALGALLPPRLSGFGWHAVGRLDRNTTGALLFTNDERLVAHVTAPATHLPKRYVVTVSGTITPEKLERLRSGVEVGGRVTRPAAVRLRGGSVIEIVLTEGRYHQVKLMMNSVQLATLALHRDAIGKYELDVEVGRFRELREEDIERLLGYLPRQLRHDNEAASGRLGPGPE